MKAVLRAAFLLALGLGIGFWYGRGGRPAPPLPPPPLAAAPVATVPPPVSRPPRLGLACSVTASFHDNVFPSLVLSLGGAHPEYARCLTVTVLHAPVGRSCELRIESALFTAPLVYAATVPSESWVLTPDLPWNYAALRGFSQNQPELFVVSVTAGSRTVQTTLTANVHGINEAVSRVYDPDTGDWEDTSVCYAAFVNEDHPWINGLLQEALARGGVDHFTGYELGAASVLPQLQAIWDALAARRLSYVDLATVSSSGGDVDTQYVRFLDQSVRDQGANCVDASVLLASIFRRIGLRPVLIFRPGHCFIGVYDAPTGGQLIALETTALSAAPFAAALSFGSQELQTTIPNLGTPGFSEVDIALAREQGVRPIGFEP